MKTRHGHIVLHSVRALTNATPKIPRTAPKNPYLHKKSLNRWWCSIKSEHMTSVKNRTKYDLQNKLK